MLANHEEAPTRVQLTEKRARTKITIRNPQIIRRDRGEHRPQQRALLRMPIFTRKDIGDQAWGGLIDHERLAGQSTPGGLTQGFEPMFAGFKTVTIDNFDPVAVEPGRTFTAHLGNQGGELTGTIAYQLGRGASF